MTTTKAFAIPYTLYRDQKGISSLVLLFMIVLGVFLLWEMNEYIGVYTISQEAPNSGANTSTRTYCKSGETGNCNDSNDQFLLTE